MRAGLFRHTGKFSQPQRRIASPQFYFKKVDKKVIYIKKCVSLHFKQIQLIL